jgi:nitrite reductase/ring-hydroxylating ferredoxin subunit
MILAHKDDIPLNSTKGFELSSGKQIFVVHKDSGFYAYENRCPHLGIELNWLPDQFLDIENNLIQCATHGALFLPETGECIAGPCVGQPLTLTPITLTENGDITLTEEI